MEFASDTLLITSRKVDLEGDKKSTHTPDIVKDEATKEEC